MVKLYDKEIERFVYVVILFGLLLFFYKLVWLIENWKRDNKGRSDVKWKNGNFFVIFGWFCYILFLYNCFFWNYDYKIFFL